MNFLVDSYFQLPANGAVKLAWKNKDFEAEIVNASNNFFTISTADKTAGKYFYQTFDENNALIENGEFNLIANLATAQFDFDPRSQAEITLEAIDAVLAGRATTQQQSIAINGMSISYSSFDELKKWRTHFWKLVQIEKGKSIHPSNIVLQIGS